MESFGVLLFVSTLLLLYCCNAEENINPSVPLVTLLKSSKIQRRQIAGGDPNLEGIFGQQSGNFNPSSQFNNNNNANGQFSPSNSGRPQFGFPESGEGSPNNNGGFGGFNNNPGFNNPNQGSSNGGFSNQGSSQGTSNNGGNQGTFGNANGFDNSPSNQWPYNNNGAGGFNNNQGSSGGTNAQTTQRTPLNQIALQTTIDDVECSRRCRNRLTQQYLPVCGSDSITYLNQQVFDCYKRECRGDVTVLYSGSCVTTRAPST